MFSPLVTTTVSLPLALGLALAFGLGRGAGHRFAVLAALCAIMISYLVLEGMPVVPPISAKHKIPYLLLLAAVLVALVDRLRLPILPVVAGFLIVAAGWLGWNRLSAAGGFAASWHVLVPIVTATFASTRLAGAEKPGLEWQITLLCVALGGAGLAALGAFVGFAQVSGAFAALFGAYVLVRYVLLITGRAASFAPLSAPATSFLLLALVSVLILIGLLAPEISKTGYVILSLGLLAPVVLPRLTGQPAALRPILQGVLAALPAIAAVLVAL